MEVLPDEIWEQIFANFEDYMPLKNWWMYGAQLKHQRHRTLYSLSLVSHHFQRVAYSFLYRTLLLEGGDYEARVHMLLLRTLSEDPLLGQHVRNVSFDDSTGSPRRMSSTLTGTPVDSILKAGLESLNLQPAVAKRLETSILDGCGFGTLAIAYMPQLEFVDCSLNHNQSPLPLMLSGRLGVEHGLLRQPDREEKNNEDAHDDDDRINEKNAPISIESMPTDYSFPNLTEVRIRAGSSESISPILVIEPILLHPTLKRLRTFGIDWSGDAGKQLEWHDRVSNLQYLDLKESIIDAAGLRSVLSRCPNLEGLSIQMAGWHREGYREDDSWIVNLDDFGNVLRQFGQGLGEFDIHTLDYKLNHATDGRLGSFQALSSLKHLKLDKQDFLGTVRDLGEDIGPLALRFNESLPPSLETLYLHWSSYEHRRQIVNEEIHALIIGNELPNLRQIQVERYYNKTMQGEWDPDLKVDGWDVSVKNEHLWETYDG
ncbi:hypothetical protein ACLX1H_008991 [Fusarium chlamydosporum]